MSYTEQEARRAVIDAGHRLLKAGLVARTWGNISARISDSAFLITPSGRAYDTLRPEDLVIVDMNDLTYEGSRKPSSEKGIHADAYRLRPDIHFIIHTHQLYASVFGVGGQPLENGMTDGPVPCAAYGLPSTDRLRKAVAREVEDHPDALAILMKNHGALCMGKDEADAFKVSRQLEAACQARLAFLRKRILAASLGEADDYGKSVRKGSRFLLTYKGKKRIYDMRHMPDNPSKAARLHAAIYKKTHAACVYHDKSRAVRAWSRKAALLRPYVDDLAQIGGTCIECVDGQDISRVTKALESSNAVCLFGNGALCVGASKEDALAVSMILKKGALAALYAQTLPDCAPLGKSDAFLQRMIYLQNYSKKKEDGGC